MSDRFKFSTINKVISFGILGIVLLFWFLFCNNAGRTNIEDIHNCVIVKQHCGFDNLDAGYYHVKDLITGKVERINVDIRDCSVYNVGDTIK